MFKRMIKEFKASFINDSDILEFSLKKRLSAIDDVHLYQRLIEFIQTEYSDLKKCKVLQQMLIPQAIAHECQPIKSKAQVEAICSMHSDDVKRLLESSKAITTKITDRFKGVSYVSLCLNWKEGERMAS